MFVNSETQIVPAGHELSAQGVVVQAVVCTLETARSGTPADLRPIAQRLYDSEPGTVLTNTAPNTGASVTARRDSARATPAQRRHPAAVGGAPLPVVAPPPGVPLPPPPEQPRTNASTAASPTQQSTRARRTHQGSGRTLTMCVPSDTQCGVAHGAAPQLGSTRSTLCTVIVPACLPIPGSQNSAAT